jgi:hypothetical protein
MLCRAYTKDLAMRYLFAFLLISFTSLSHAYTVEQGLMCSDDGDICIDGLLKVDTAKGTVFLRGRVKSTTRPGYVRMTLHGYTEGKIFQAVVQGRLKGKYSEVVDLENGASHSDDAMWRLIRFEYLAVE